MFEAFNSVIQSLPTITKNWKALLFLAFTGIIVGFSGFPLWILYRNEEEVIEFLRTFSEGSKVQPYPREQLILVRERLKTLIQKTNATRAIFGIIEDHNRLILVEAYAPLEEPLPLGFQSVYLDSEDYVSILNTLRLDSCLYLNRIDQSSYFRAELEISNADYYLVCPSNSNWFIALYLPEKTDSSMLYLGETIGELEGLLGLDLGKN